MRTDHELPALSLAAWQATRDTLHQYARLAGKIRAAMMPRQKHWWHITLHAAANGLTTTPMPVNLKTVELLLDCTQHCFTLTSSHGEVAQVSLQGKSIAAVHDAVVGALAGMGARPVFDGSAFVDREHALYDAGAMACYWHARAVNLISVGVAGTPYTSERYALREECQVAVPCARAGLPFSLS